MVFFRSFSPGVLLLHLTVRQLDPKRQAILHVVLLSRARRAARHSA